MKKVILLAFFGLLALHAWPQVVIAPMNSVVDVKALNRSYPMAVSESERATVRDLTFQKLISDYWLDFRRFLKKNNFRPDSSFLLSTELYVRADGFADRLHYQYTIANVRPSLKTEQTLLALLSTYLTKHPLPVTSSLVWTTFRIGSQLSIMGPSARKTPKGPGVIGDLASAAQTTRPDTVKKILFANLELEQVPPIIYRFVNVEEISLGSNYLTSLPAQLTALPRLTRLDLMSNRLREDSVFFTRNTVVKAINLQKNNLTQIPASIQENRRLESLWLGNNDLKELNIRAISRLRRLNDLNLYNVGLTQLPKTIGRLKHVKVLDLYYNNLTTLPGQIGRMKRLEQLAIAHNKVRDLPASLGKLRRLTVLFAHHNRISQLPDKLQRLRTLHVLDLGYNSISVAPPVLKSFSTLEELALNNNELREFPSMLTSLKSLKKVYLSSNPLFGREAMDSPYAPQIKALEANNTQVLY
ncbi:leucine-rich repeat domain-containing protein [Spirosoma radiotolerans]|uniref:Disease resistance R13L4/SHOC-2-like LRR domain-containing protein n=1 Tax=Spirosoma radiotolerans TaxID=1379870 RepID=A0A0E3V6Q2_9BACT|nr:leucine-rich repeat domain-containing protein [Spirosoma radiotolerans]AKD55217.1 hypothetical protein SD10_10165 [Spirosoma radiotolerans]